VYRYKYKFIYIYVYTHTLLFCHTTGWPPLRFILFLSISSEYAVMPP